jgi:hypothetical protein
MKAMHVSLEMALFVLYPALVLIVVVMSIL